MSILSTFFARPGTYIQLVNGTNISAFSSSGVICRCRNNHIFIYHNKKIQDISIPINRTAIVLDGHTTETNKGFSCVAIFYTLYLIININNDQYLFNDKETHFFHCFSRKYTSHRKIFIFQFNMNYYR